MTDESDPRLTFFPQDEPIDGATVFCDRWWVKHPDKGLVVWRGFSPQCNTIRNVVERIAKLYPWAVVEFVPVAYVVIDQGE